MARKDFVEPAALVITAREAMVLIERFIVLINIDLVYGKVLVVLFQCHPPHPLMGLPGWRCRFVRDLGPRARALFIPRYCHPGSECFCSMMSTQ
jgi:hypothetical protein